VSGQITVVVKAVLAAAVVSGGICDAIVPAKDIVHEIFTNL